MEKFDLENFPVSESAKNMVASVSDRFYDNSYVGKWLYEVMGQEYDTAREIATDILNQLFPETATWGLMYHEIKWGLPVRENLPYEERRQLIYRKRDYRVPMTPYRMEVYLKKVTGFDVRIADINDPGNYGFVALHPNIFKVYIFNQKILNSKLIHEILNNIKQSHTTYILNQQITAINVEHVFRDELKNVKCCIRLYAANGIGTSVKIQLLMRQADEDIGNVTVEERRNLWYLDGKVKLDGSRIMNAMYRKEVLK